MITMVPKKFLLTSVLRMTLGKKGGTKPLTTRRGRYFYRLGDQATTSVLELLVSLDVSNMFSTYQKGFRSDVIRT